MAKKARTLDTPFRKGERVQTTRTLDDIAEGATGKVKLANGLGNWRRYWIIFSDGSIRGQISHENLVRPSQIDEWLQREEDRAAAAAASASATSVEATATTSAGAAGNDLASQIPQALLDRSKAAKARLLGA